LTKFGYFLLDTSCSEVPSVLVGPDVAIVALAGPGLAIDTLAGPDLVNDARHGGFSNFLAFYVGYGLVALLR
jgi:hypothetical protein